MKKMFLASAGVAAAALLGAGAAHAASGYVGVGYGSGTQDADGIDGWGVNGAAAFDGGGALGFQLDGGVTNVDAGSGSDETIWNIGGHLFNRGETMLWGGFVNFANGDETDISQWNVGGEAQFYTSQATIGLAASWGNVDLGGVADADIWSLGGDVKFFATDNFSLGGGVTYNNLSDSGSDDNYTAWNVGAEYQFDGAPISLSAGYQTAQIDPADLGFWKVGAKYNFGGLTLKDRSQKGAGLNQRGGFLNDILGGT